MTDLENKTEITIANYSERAIVVRGPTEPHKEALKELGGKWNRNLKDGPGWIFSKKSEPAVTAYLKSEPLSPKAKPAQASNTKAVLERLRKDLDHFDQAQKLNIVKDLVFELRIMEKSLE
jgi:hypothetical protein